MAYTHTLTHTADVASYWDTQAYFADTLRTTQLATTLGCNLLRVSWTRTTPASTREDLVTVNLHIAKVVGGGQFSPLITAEFSPIETAFSAFWSALSTNVTNTYTLSEYRWFECRASHGAYDDGSEVIGPPVRIAGVSLTAGGGAARLPDQDSATITWRTCSRKHWGRIYVPGLTTVPLTTAYGRIGSVFVDLLANSMHTFIAGLITNAQTIGVWTYRHKAFLDISELRVDDIVDIQRRRRAKNPSYTKSYTS